MSVCERFFFAETTCDWVDQTVDQTPLLQAYRLQNKFLAGQDFSKTCNSFILTLGAVNPPRLVFLMVWEGEGEVFGHAVFLGGWWSPVKKCYPNT